MWQPAVPCSVWLFGGEGHIKKRPKNEKRFVEKRTYATVHRLDFLPVTFLPHYCDLSHCLARPAIFKVWPRGPWGQDLIKLIFLIALPGTFLSHKLQMHSVEECIDC